MGKTIKAFDYEIDIYGARVIISKEPLHSSCLSDDEVDNAIQLLKDDLDVVARKMKLAIREQEKKPSF